VLKVSLQHRVGAFDLDVEFETGALVLGVFGPSGAGKTTLLNLIAGLENPTSRGRIELDGVVFLDTERGVRVAAPRRRVGVVFQEHRLFPHYTVAGNLDYGLALTSHSGQRLQRGTVVDMLELGPLLERSVRDLSGGERQRVALGRALLASPRLLLLDEPLSSLDRRLKEQILPYLRRVRDAAGVPMLYVSHDLTEVLRVTDRLLLLQGGRVAGNGPVRELAHDARAGAALQEAGLVNVFSLNVATRGAEDGLLTLAVPAKAEQLGSVLRVPMSDVPGSPETGGHSRVEVAIRPEDVGIALHEVHGSSIQNQLPGMVERVSTNGGRTIVQVDVGVPLLAQVSHRSAEALGLRAGLRVYCLIKSLAVRALGYRESL
jgi:molybdate transport system ATP-binding protein